jgi:hypothetical protein
MVEFHYLVYRQLQLILILSTQIMSCRCIYLSNTNIELIDWLIIYCFTSRSRIFHLYKDVTITGEGLQNLDLKYARRSRPLSREGSLSCHTYFDTRTRFFRSHSKDRPIQSPFTTHMGMRRIYSNPDPHGVRYSLSLCMWLKIYLPLQRWQVGSSASLSC